MATNQATNSENTIHYFTNKDVTRRGFKVTSEVYAKYKPQILEIINEIDLSEPLFLYRDPSPEFSRLLFSDSESSNIKYLEHFERFYGPEYGPHFCFMILKVAADSATLSTTDTDRQLKTIVNKIIAEARIFRSLQLNVIEIEATAITHLPVTTSQKITEQNFQPIEQYPPHSIHDGSPPHSPKTYYTSDPNPGDSIGSTYYQHQASIESQCSTDDIQNVIDENVSPTEADLVNCPNLQLPQSPHTYTSTTISGDSEGSNGSFPYPLGEEEVLI